MSGLLPVTVGKQRKASTNHHHPLLMVMGNTQSRIHFSDFSCFILSCLFRSFVRAPNTDPSPCEHRPPRRSHELVTRYTELSHRAVGSCRFAELRAPHDRAVMSHVTENDPSVRTNSHTWTGSRPDLSPDPVLADRNKAGPKADDFSERTEAELCPYENKHIYQYIPGVTR